MLRQMVRSFHFNPPQFKIIPFLLADIGEGITECEVVQWFVKPGDRIEQFTKICEVQSDKASVEITSRYEGLVQKLNYEVGQVAKVGSSLVEIDVPDDDSTPTSAPKHEPLKSEPPSQTQNHLTAAADSVPQAYPAVLATPAVRRIAKENSINLSKVSGTGPDGRILKGDVLQYLSTGGEMTPPVAATPTQQKKSETPNSPIPLTTMQKAMFKSMTESLSIPHFGYSDEISLNGLSDSRKLINQYLANSESSSIKKISYMPLFIKALSLALLKFPILNAALVNDDTVSTASLLYRSEHNIGIAMDTPQGLIVPNVKNVESKSIIEIATELERLRECGRKKSFSSYDLQHGTITLSNIGNIGGTVLHPVIVSGQLCIGSIGRMQRIPRFEEVDGVEKVIAKEIMNVSFNADHRVIDGATMARFVSAWKSYLENPGIMLSKMR